MEKSESSDSDSNCSTSWVLVYDNTPPLENANPFHLDCSREPIQELTEHDLLSAGSDLESDTDGVSVISESEAVEEELNEKTCEETSDLQVSNDECVTLSDQITLKNLDKPLVTNVKKLFTNANIVGVGVVLTAVFLGSYTMIVQRNSGKDNSVDLKDFIIYDDDNINSNIICKTDAVLDNQLEEIVDMTIACTYEDQDENVLKSKDIKQCVKVRYETQKSVKQTQTDSSGTTVQSGEDNGTQVVETSDKIWTSDKQIIDEYEKNEKKKKHIDETIKDKSKKFVRSHNQTRKYIKDKQFETSTNSKYKVGKKNDKDSDHRPKYEKFKRDLHTTNQKVYKSKFGNSKRSYEVKFKPHAVKKNCTSKEFKDLDRSGEWYSDWHKARRQLRKHDLVDERYPNKKKTKMQWYFKWMSGREELRYKKNYRPYSS